VSERVQKLLKKSLIRKSVYIRLGEANDFLGFSYVQCINQTSKRRRKGVWVISWNLL